MSMATRITPADRLLAAFELAERAGLTEPEMRRAAGRSWRPALAELQERGHTFNVRVSRYSRRPWRWVHIGPPLPPPRPESPAEVPAPVLDVVRSSQAPLFAPRPVRDA